MLLKTQFWECQFLCLVFQLHDLDLINAQAYLDFLYYIESSFSFEVTMTEEFVVVHHCRCSPLSVDSCKTSSIRVREIQHILGAYGHYGIKIFKNGFKDFGVCDHHDLNCDCIIYFVYNFSQY